MATRLGLSIALLYLLTLTTSEDLPCRARDLGIEGRSVVCVCDAEYCDTITRENPAPGTYVVYTTSNAGQRFEKSFGELQLLEQEPPPTEPPTTTTEAPTTTSSPGITLPPPTFLPPPPPPRDPVDGVPDFDEKTPVNDVPDFDEDTWLYNTTETENATIFNTVNLRILPNSRFQYIEGFGGSVTDAAAINWRKLSDAAQVRFINSYFGPEGLEYNLIRVPIAGADFSTHPYTYNEYPWYDAALSNYSLTDEDNFLKLPMIRRSLRVATDEVKITASTWSPPVWMKTNERITGFGQLRPEFFQAFADYHLRFIEEYAKAEVKIWAITTTNEPINGIIPLAPFNSLGWLPSAMARWVANNLGPTIRNSPFNSTKILAADEQRYLLHFYVLGMEREDPKALDYIDGVAIHYYGNFFPPAILTDLQMRYPDKILLSTEACEGAMPWHQMRVEIGSWRRARRYVTAILEDLNNYVVGWIDWNLCLSPTGGPNWADNFVDAPILVFDGENEHIGHDEFIKQPMFYAMGHFSKFIPRGSQRIMVSRTSLIGLQHLAVITPRGNIVMVLQNRYNREMNVNIRLQQRFLNFTMEPESIKTIEINHNY